MSGCNYMALPTRLTCTGQGAVISTFAGQQFENTDQYIKLIFSLKKLFQTAYNFYKENRLITELISVAQYNKTQSAYLYFPILVFGWTLGVRQ